MGKLLIMSGLRCVRGQRSEVAHLELFTLLEGEALLADLGSPSALFGVAHDGVGVAMAVETRVEVKGDSFCVVTDVDREPEDTSEDTFMTFTSSSVYIKICL